MSKIELFKVYMSKKAPELVKEVLLSGWIGQAKKVEEFEAMLRKWFGADHCNTVNSGTSGLHLCLHHAKLRDERNPRRPPGDRKEVLTTPLTCTATNFAILANHLNLKWVDVDPMTCNLDMDDLERKISPRTLAIMVVHWGGMACDLDRLKQIQIKCQSLYGHTPPVIEDCAHAWGAKYDGKLIGTHGNPCVFSFQAIKHLTTGDGGLVISPDLDTHLDLKLLRWYGLDRESTADFRCLHPMTLVRLADWTTMPIHRLVSEQHPGPVLTCENNKLVARKVVNWHKNEIGTRKIVKLSTSSLHPQCVAKVTDDHLILTDRGWKEAGRLINGDKIATGYPSPSKIQMQILTGSLLGDGNLTCKQKTRKTALFQERHTQKDQEYLLLKAKSLSGLMVRTGVSEKRPEQKRPHPVSYLYTKTSPALAAIANRFYKDGKKVVCRQLVEENFTPLLLATWYCDDGGVSRIVPQRDGLAYRVSIATNSFNKEDCDWLCDLLCRNGYECKVGHSHGYRLYFTTQGSRRLLETVAPYVPVCMRYKVGFQFRAFDPSLWGDGGSETHFDKVVASPYTGPHYRHVYCIEVEGGANNFATTSVIVHNCAQNIHYWGYKMHMNDINAAIGICNLPESEEVVRVHRENGKYYDEHLQDVPGLTLLGENPKVESSYWVYTIRVKNRAGFQKRMLEHGIVTSLVHKRNDLHPCVQDFRSLLPGLEVVSNDMVAMPCGWWVTPEDREHVLDTIKQGW